MNNINFRSAIIEDLPILYEFEQGIVTTERPWDPTLQDEHINYYDLKALIESPDAEVIVALINDKIIASAYAKSKKADPYLKFENYAYLGFMYVKPEHRGKGIIQKIIEKLANWAKSKNFTELRLDVYNDNLKAIRAYEKYGFKKHTIKMRIEIE